MLDTLRANLVHFDALRDRVEVFAELQRPRDAWQRLTLNQVGAKLNQSKRP